MTKLFYQTDAQKLDFTAHVIAVEADERGTYFVLDQTYFYPQGGGQPADTGTVLLGDGHTGIVHFAKLVEGVVRHYCETVAVNWSGQNVHCHVDEARRVLNMRYHTAAHVIAIALEALGLKATKGHQFPGEAYVECENAPVDVDVAATDLQAKVDALVHEDRSVSVSMEGARRFVQIAGSDRDPCGGTHVSRLSEIGKIEITKLKRKGSVLRVSYAVS